MAAKPVSNFSDCPLCAGTLRELRTLNCQHQICTGCLQQYVSSLTETGIFHCPTCNSENKLSSHSKSLCTNSKHGPATVFCADCKEFYCKNCASSHGHITITRDHNMIPVTRMSTGDTTRAMSAHMKSVCEKHHSLADILCKTCQKAICTTCILFDHKNHLYKEVAISAGEVQEDLKHIIVQTAEYMAKQEEVLRDMRITKNHICASVRDAKQKVEKAANEMCDIIKKELVRDLDCHQAKALQKLKSIEEDAEDNRAGASKLKQETERLCESGDAVDQVMRTPAIQKQFGARNKLPQQNMTWKYVPDHNNQTQESLIAMFGTVKLKTLSVIRPRKRITLGYHLHQIALSYEDDEMVSGLVVIGDRMCVTHYKDPQLWLYDIVSGDIRTSKVPELQNPCGMVLVKSTNSLVLTDESNTGGKLHFMAISTNLRFTRLRVKSIPVKRPRGISVSRETGELLIGQEKSAQFVICNEEGDVLRRVTVPDAGSGCCPRYVTESKVGFAALMCDKHSKKQTKSTIQWFGQNGKCSHAYGCKDSEQIKRGQHMVTDSEGRLIVVDYPNHRLHLVDTIGHLSQFLLTEADGIKFPQCVYLDEASSRLYVAVGEVGSVKVCIYRWSPQSGDSNTTNFELGLSIVRL